ncbi:MAG TPA: NADH-quinone oxidoreductase subunit C [Tenuifilaceae bacterium]|nr:NADH-quinone oxidoreductase subunit C [Tenuifilaceae bacterium]HPE17922.1 NADH-quinone oxidoreductase subunit C [Tenuifilaceae bacterium]HPJ45405.1 NADH-quinone oxidoreductase subunit C [Tenuifilaceae bacterium]HRX68380.1 NADH-quinone oxidoreductase subunit C [Tenuifilaceae bacterium]
MISQFENIKQLFQLEEITQQREGLILVTAPREQIVSFVTHLRDALNYKHLVILTAVDWIEKNQFQLSYILNNPFEKCDVIVRTFIDREEATMTSIHHLWEQAATYQRELREMFGIDFPGSPRVDKPFMLEGWDNIPPYRRDFDTKKYSEETYFPRPGRETNDPTEFMKKKLYPDEP